MTRSEIHVGDCLDVLRTLSAGSARTCVTSPPYWGLRDYGVPGQLGLEPTPQEYVEKMVAVFREVRRVLADDGTLWLNLGDCYAAQRGGTQMPAETLAGGTHRGRASARQAHRDASAFGLKHKDLVGIPWRVAFALQADGWYLRSDIIWSKPNPMPESVTDRPTKAHEYLFLMAKSERYLYDAAAIAEPATHAGRWRVVDGTQKMCSAGDGVNDRRTAIKRTVRYADLRNRRNVWTIPTMGYRGAHFAVMPPKLVEPCILAGSRHGDTVIDPFAGAGTVGLVASRHGRNFVGIELNPAYADMARERIRSDAPLFSGERGGA